ncbi:transglycosylase SLT domain-containing protein [Streptomyces olivochromogenes]|uniref:Bacteriophage tape measure protein n=1 Tax=Streptomyces olivochromogenes TaxID=1963 RepID=A0A250VKL2_STROL|nr:transglycosylase SLT domain-containing protein [Streptomyces olivochromogenes]GAX54748.1 bacteriophage tape measure protein [Streptomyces olivochromogenes]
MPVGFKIASAWVDVNADTRGLREEIKREVRTATSGTNRIKITANLDATRAKSEISKLAKNQTLKLRVSLDSAQAKSEIRKLGRNVTIKVKVEVDTAEARRRIDALGRNRSVRLGADVNSAGASAQLAFLTRARTVQINTRVNQTVINQVTNNLNSVTRAGGSASRAMRLLRLVILGMAVAPGILGATASMLKTIATSSAIAVPAVLALGAAFAAIKTGLSGVGSALSAGFSSKSSKGSASAQISSARQIEDAKRSLMRAQRDLQYTEEDSAKAIVAAQRQVKDAQQNLRDAEVQSAQDRADAAERVKQAQEDLSRTYEDVARANAQAVRQVQDAEDNLRDAQEKARQAQADLTQARKDAAEQLVDLNNKLKDAQLDQRDAVLDLKDAQDALDNARMQTNPVAAADAYTKAIEEQKAAQDALNAVRAKGAGASDMEKAQAEAAFANASSKAAQAAENLAKAQGGQTSAEDIERAQLNYDRAKQALEEQTLETDRLKSQTEDANKAGVEGSAQVKDAKDNIKKANEDVADAAQKVKDAEADAAQTAEDGARRVKDAQDAVSDSVKAQAKVYQDSARAIQDAQRQVSDAQQGVADAHEQASRDILSANENVADSARNLAEAYQDAGKAGDNAAQTFSDAMKKLSPNARSFVQTVLDIAPAWRKVKLSIQDALFSGWDSKLRELSDQTLPDVQTGLTDTATIFNGMGKSIADSLINLSKAGTLKRLFSGLNGAMKPLEKTPGKLTTAFAQIGVAASPALKKFTTWLADKADKWADKIGKTFANGTLEKKISASVKKIADAYNSIKNNPEFQKFLKAMREQGPAAGEAMKDIAQALLKVSTSLGYGVGAALFKLAQAASLLVLALPDWFIQGLLVFAGTLKTLLLITSVAKAVRLWVTAQYALNGAFLLSPLTWILIGIAALVAIVVVIATKTHWFQDIWAAAWGGIKTAFSFVYDFIKNNWPLIVGILTGPVGIAVVMILKHWDSIKAGLKLAWDWLKSNVFFPIRDFFTVTIPGWSSTLKKKIVDTWNSWVNATKATFQSWKDWVTAKFNSFKDSVSSITSSIRDKWKSFVSGLKSAWSDGWNSIKSKWDSISSAVRGGMSTFSDKIKSTFRSAVSGVKSIWNTLEGIFKSPVRFLINTVVNKGIVGTINWVLGKVGVGSKIPTVGVPKGFASGGPVRGRGTSTSDSIPARLSNGEHVLTAKDVQALGGHAGVMALRQGGGRRTALMKKGVAHASLGGAIGNFFEHPLDSIGKGGKWLWDQGVKWTRAAAAKFVSVAYNNIVNPIMGHIPFGGSSKALAKGVPAYFKNKIVDYVKGKGDEKQKAVDAASGIGNYKPGAGVAQWAGVVRNALSQVGEPLGLTNTTLRRMNQESGGNPKAVNLWDSNAKAGYPSVGLMQVIRPTFQHWAGKYAHKGPFMYGTSIDPLANVYSSMRYAKGAYGSLSRAYNRAGGYANGGMARGLSLVGERGPELINAGSGSRVSSNSETRGLLTGGNTYNIDVHIDGTLDTTNPSERKKFAKEMASDIKEAIRKDDLGRGR